MTISSRSKRERTTADLVLSPEEWGPITKWTKQARPAYGDRRLGMDVEQSKAIDAVERRAKTLERNPKGYQKDMTLRMNRELLQDLYELFRFWECCQDELPSGAQRDMPKWEYFADAASEVEGTLNLWPQPKSQPVRNCLECGQPITAGQRMVALVDFDHVGAYATVRHRDCANA